MEGRKHTRGASTRYLPAHPHFPSVSLTGTRNELNFLAATRGHFRADSEGVTLADRCSSLKRAPTSKRQRRGGDYA